MGMPIPVPAIAILMIPILQSALLVLLGSRYSLYCPIASSTPRRVPTVAAFSDQNFFDLTDSLFGTKYEASDCVYELSQQGSLPSAAPSVVYMSCQPEAAMAAAGVAGAWEMAGGVFQGVLVGGSRPSVGAGVLAAAAVASCLSSAWQTVSRLIEQLCRNSNDAVAAALST